jgi:hypothetical protein
MYIGRLQPGYLAVLGHYPDWPIRVVEILVLISQTSSIAVVVRSYCYYGKLLLQRSTPIQLLSMMTIKRQCVEHI